MSLPSPTNAEENPIPNKDQDQTSQEQSPEQKPLKKEEEVEAPHLQPYPLTRHANLHLHPCTPKGRGIITPLPIPAHTHLETSPVLILSQLESRDYLLPSALRHYTYNWPITLPSGKVSVTQAVVFGLGSLFNHSRRPNVGWRRDVERECVVYSTLREVQAGEELCISYGERVGFVDVDGEGEEGEGEGEEAVEEVLGRIRLGDEDEDEKG